MSTPFDDDFLQEGLGHGLYGISRSPTANPGLGQALLSGLDAPAGDNVTLYLYPGEDSNGFDHIGMSVNGGHAYGKAPIPGMKLQSLGETVRGIVEPVNPNRKPTDQVTIHTSADQSRYLQNYLQDRSQPVTYDAKKDNCANYIYNGLKGAGVKVPSLSGIMFPYELMNRLHQMYDVPVQHHLVSTWPTLPKY